MQALDAECHLVAQFPTGMGKTLVALAVQRARKLQKQWASEMAAGPGKRDRDGLRIRGVDATSSHPSGNDFGAPTSSPETSKGIAVVTRTREQVRNVLREVRRYKGDLLAAVRTGRKELCLVDSVQKAADPNKACCDLLATASGCPYKKKAHHTRWALNRDAPYMKLLPADVVAEVNATTGDELLPVRQVIKGGSAQVFAHPRPRGTPNHVLEQITVVASDRGRRAFEDIDGAAKMVLWSGSMFPDPYKTEAAQAEALLGDGVSSGIRVVSLPDASVVFRVVCGSGASEGDYVRFESKPIAAAGPTQEQRVYLRRVADFIAAICNRGKKENRVQDVASRPLLSRKTDLRSKEDTWPGFENETGSGFLFPLLESEKQGESGSAATGVPLRGVFVIVHNGKLSEGSNKLSDFAHLVLAGAPWPPPTCARPWDSAEPIAGLAKSVKQFVGRGHRGFDIPENERPQVWGLDWRFSMMKHTVCKHWLWRYHINTAEALQSLDQGA
eukprot:g20016.t1